MLKFPEVVPCRLISLSWVDKKEEGHNVIICAVDNFDKENEFINEYNNHGWLFNKVVEVAGVDLATADHVRLTSSTLPYLC